MTKGIIMTSDNKSFRIQDIIFYNADFLKLDTKNIKADLIITSPPYNIGIDYRGATSSAYGYADNKTYKEYLEFTKAWLAKCYEILKSKGRICINIPIDTGKNGKRSLLADITILAKRAGFKYKGTIIWNKQNSKNKFSMSFSKNLEVILILYKDEWIPVKKEFKDYVNEIWQFSGENSKRVSHPAAFPLEIPRRLIKMFSEIGDVIFDPFMGSGTTMVTCKQLFRKGIGVEISEEYFKNIKNRLENKIL